MPYNRRYSLDEVHQILCDSERRKRPSGGSELGHAITRHADGRSDILDKRYRSVIHLFATLEETRASGPIPNGSLAPSKFVGGDSRFLTRMDVIRAVYQALNSPTGQTKLAELATGPSVTITVPLDRALGIRGEAAVHPTIKTGTGKAKKAVEAPGPSAMRQGIALEVFVLIDRIAAGDPASAIHIHTAYPTSVG